MKNNLRKENGDKNKEAEQAEKWQRIRKKKARDMEKNMDK